MRERGWELLALAYAASGCQVEAMRALQDARERLREAGLEPGPGLRRVESEILLAAAAPPTPRFHNLRSPLTGFVGRTAELAQLGNLITDHRLVTVTGVGGVGKSRLALEVARRALTESSLVDECWLVELATEHDPSAVMARVVAALGGGSLGTLREQFDETLRRLSAARVLVVLDNCEHVLDAVAPVAKELTEAGPDVRLIATSRVPLGVTGECLYDVPPLGLPATDVPEEVEAADAVRLFAERIQLSVPALAIGQPELQLIAALCRSLDGVPLAIELAAGRVRSLGLAEVAARASERMQLLVGGGMAAPARHRTMEATLDWSFELLDPAARALFCRMAVFPGAMTRSAIVELCVDGDWHDDPLELLVSHSLVIASHESGTTTYRLLETVREFALARLEPNAMQELRERRRRHLSRDRQQAVVSRAGPSSAAG